MKEKDIKWEGSRFWVLHEKGVFKICEKMGTHSVVIEGYRDESIAVARAQYIDKRRAA